MNSERKKIVAGLKWSSVQLFVDSGFRFLVQLVLAKILLPEQFGLVAMCSIFIAIANAASELGMGAALIQKKEDSIAQSMYPTAFISGIIWGGFLFLIMSFLIGPIAAWFYQEPFLTYLIPALSISVIVTPLSFIHHVILVRKMDFKSLATILNTSAVLAGVVAIVSAFLGAGVWSLVVNQVLSPLLAMLFYYYKVGWKPKLNWNRQHFKAIFGFGAYATGTRIFSTVTYNIDNLLIGKLLGSSPLGAYSLAFNLTETLRQSLSKVINNVMFPVFGKNQDNIEKLKNYFLNIIKINAILIYPVMGFLLLFSHEIIFFIFGDKWENAVIPIQILSVAMMIHLMINSFTSLLRGIGKPELEMKIIMVLTLLVLIPGLVVGIKVAGLIGAAYAILINKSVLVLTALVILKREINLKVSQVFRTVLKPVLALVVSIALVYLFKANVNSSEGIIPLLLPMAMYVICYLGVIYYLEKKTMQRFLTVIKNKNV
ncbi:MULTISPECIES: lipopolysaccharide biosynthesis protein [Flavobacteriaceae]|uniref:lipopolysaccharide biosynthesis protein n=1 Tax=Flavobacteriaceae TaxID=49546 RepID=UPI0014920773|nr:MULTISPECIES: lipopolysaccharide biosynthesis protein [Allomuricauda]MDC6366494.1 lipopolysaccharide biosynthesis protein [Muricauda sp. AC10]